jgi:peptidoglycan/LPS O-acetylase OafA/YrhL
VKPAIDDPIKKWEVKPSAGKHFDVLDGFRGVAILMVVIHHTFYTNPQNAFLGAVQGLIASGWIGVPVFFVLSGFLISYPFFQAKSKVAGKWYVDGYARRRIGKIVPPFYLSIVIFSLFYMFRYHDAAYLKSAWEWALGLPNFIMIEKTFNSSYWSLIVEVHFYLVLPFLFFLTRRLNTRHAAGIIFFVLAAAAFSARQLTWPADAAAPANQMLTVFLMSRFPCQMDYFAWGVLFGGIFVSLASFREKARPLALLGYAGAVLFVTTLCLYAGWGRTYGIDGRLDLARWSVEFFHWAPAGSAFLMLFFVFDPLCAGSRLLGSAWLRFVGIVSYEWFLFHAPVVWFFAGLYGRTHGSVPGYALKTLAPLALTFLFSVAVYRWFSLPVLNRIRAGISK